jgi:hypothetical protein
MPLARGLRMHSLRHEVAAEAWRLLCVLFIPYSSDDALNFGRAFSIQI